MVRIILADHHVKSRWALTMMLQEEADFELIGEAESAKNLFLFATDHVADVILVDEELPGTSITDLIASLHDLSPRPFVIVMAIQADRGGMLLRAGADAFISKGDNPQWLLQSLRRYAQRNPGIA